MASSWNAESLMAMLTSLDRPGVDGSPPSLCPDLPIRGSGYSAPQSAGGLRSVRAWRGRRNRVVPRVVV